MFFFLATSESNYIQTNTTKVRVHLNTGVAEIFEQHQDLMGKVDNNIIEIETNLENRLEKNLFVLQDAVFIVSTKGLDATSQNKGTGVYVYASRVREITPNISIDSISKEYEQKNIEIESETQKINEQLSENEKKNEKDKKVLLVERILKTNLVRLKSESEFLKKVLLIVKNLKS